VRIQTVRNTTSSSVPGVERIANAPNNRLVPYARWPLRTAKPASLWRVASRDPSGVRQSVGGCMDGRTNPRLPSNVTHPPTPVRPALRGTSHGALAWLHALVRRTAASLTADRWGSTRSRDDAERDRGREREEGRAASSGEAKHACANEESWRLPPSKARHLSPKAEAAAAVSTQQQQRACAKRNGWGLG
jgi:hypothetical protein